jgi:hypothetical protein
MKKFIVSILAVLYMGTSIGATIHLHYCMGQLVDWGLCERGNSVCSKCGMEKTNPGIDLGCCKDEFKQIKNNKDQKLTDNFTFTQINKAVKEIGPVCFPTYSVSLSETTRNEIPIANGPPRSCITSLHKINCVFRI